MNCAEQIADTLPDGHTCRCDDVAPWDQWIGSRVWTDDQGRLIESRTCAVCECTRSIVKVQP